MSVADILERAANLIEPEGAWTQGYYAKDASGEYAEFGDESAVCWCAGGAIDRQSPDDIELANEARIALREVIGDGRGVSMWNDAPERTQAEVVSKLREAAAKARAGETA